MDKEVMEGAIRGGVVQLLYAGQRLHEQGRMVWFEYHSHVEEVTIRIAKEEVKTSKQLFAYDEMFDALEVNESLYIDRGEETLENICELYDRLVGMLNFESLIKSLSLSIKDVGDEVSKAFDKPLGQITLAEINDYMELKLKGEEENGESL